jgi:hypothetical protein
VFLIHFFMDGFGRISGRFLTAAAQRPRISD